MPAAAYSALGWSGSPRLARPPRRPRSAALFVPRLRLPLLTGATVFVLLWPRSQRPSPSRRRAAPPVVSEMAVIFFVFMIARDPFFHRIFAEMIALRLQRRAVVSSIRMSTRAYAPRTSPPNRRSTVSSQESSRSRFARTYIAHTSGLNQWTQAAAISSSFPTAVKPPDVYKFMLQHIAQRFLVRPSPSFSAAG